MLPFLSYARSIDTPWGCKGLGDGLFFSYWNNSKYFSYSLPFSSSFGINLSAAELIQYLSHPSSFGPSLNTCPRWESAFSLLTSVLVLKRLLSTYSLIKLSSIGLVNAGQPDPESYLSVEENNGVPSTIST